MIISSREQPWTFDELEDIAHERYAVALELTDKLEVARNVIEVLMEENQRFRSQIDRLNAECNKFTELLTQRHSGNAIQLQRQVIELTAKRDFFAAETDKLTAMLERCVNSMENL